MDFPKVIEVYSPTKEGEGEPFKTVVINSDLELDSLKGTHLPKGHILKEQKKIEIKGANYYVLKYISKISKYDEPVNRTRIASHFFGADFNTQKIFDDLSKGKILDIADNMVAITDLGHDVLNRKESKITELLFESIFDDFEYALIEFFFNEADFVHMSDIPEILKEHAPQYKTFINDGNIMHFMQQSKYIDEKYSRYTLNPTGIAYFKHLQNKRKNGTKPFINIDHSINVEGDFNGNANTGSNNSQTNNE